MKTSIKTVGLLAALAMGLTSPLFSQVPDLTTSNSVDRSQTYNLGPTGLRGWIYTRAASNLDAAIDVRIEGITKADQKKLDLALEEVFSPKDREALKGASNGGYHYFGSAKIFAQMGKAFAEALLPLQK